LAVGCGHLDFAKIVKTLKEIGYKGFISAEILPKPNPDRAAGMNISHLKSLLLQTKRSV
jgi:sugar phosphate isomerase/epimerase